MLKDEQLNFIRTYLVEEGIHTAALKDDLIDHFCCAVEEEMLRGCDFQHAFDLALMRISPNGSREIENDLTYLLTIKKRTMFRKTAYIFGYISLILIISGILFIPALQPKPDYPTDSLLGLADLAGLSINEHPQLRQLSDLAMKQTEPTLNELILLIGFGLFLIAVVPFWFYRGYQNSILRLQKN